MKICQYCVNIGPKMIEQKPFKLTEFRLSYEQPKFIHYSMQVFNKGSKPENMAQNDVN